MIRCKGTEPTGTSSGPGCFSKMSIDLSISLGGEESCELEADETTDEYGVFVLSSREAVNISAEAITRRSDEVNIWI